MRRWGGIGNMGHSGLISRTTVRKRNIDKHRENGICTKCSSKVSYGHSMCEKHLKDSRDRYKNNSSNVHIAKEDSK